jgi:hypothetical protein
MNRSIFLAVPICLLAALGIYAHPQRTRVELEVDGVMLHIGMVKSEVAERLAGRQYWKANDDNWVAGPPNDVGPSIQFTNGKLNFTERFWATSENDTGMAYRIEAALTGWDEEKFSDTERSELARMASPFMTGEVPDSTNMTLNNSAK